MKRYGMVIGVRPEKLAEYKRLHAAAWPEIVRLLTEAGVRNYSIFQKDELLFGYFEYHGDDLEAAFERMNAEPIVKEWYTLCEPCQVPLATRKSGEWWAEMAEVFHME
jgi:L-rhamnose mutarotase